MKKHYDVKIRTHSGKELTDEEHDKLAEMFREAHAKGLFNKAKDIPKQSNFSKITASVGALAKFMSGFMPCGCCVNCDEAKKTTGFESLEKCQQGIADWLKQEATNAVD